MACLGAPGEATDKHSSAHPRQSSRKKSVPLRHIARPARDPPSHLPAIPVPSLLLRTGTRLHCRGACKGKTVFLTWRGFRQHADWSREVRGDAEPICVDEEMRGGKEIQELFQNSRQEMLKAMISKLGTLTWGSKIVIAIDNLCCSMVLQNVTVGETR